MRGAVAVVGGVCGRAAEAVGSGPLHRLARAGALHWGRVDEQQVIVPAGALGGEGRDHRLDRLGEPVAALVEARALGQRREQVAQALAGDPGKAGIGADAHDRLRHAEGDDLRVGQSATGVSWLLGRRSSAVQNTEVSSRSRSASIVAPFGSAVRTEHRRLRPRCLSPLGTPGANLPVPSGRLTPAYGGKSTSQRRAAHTDCSLRAGKRSARQSPWNYSSRPAAAASLRPVRSRSQRSAG